MAGFLEAVGLGVVPTCRLFVPTCELYSSLPFINKSLENESVDDVTYSCSTLIIYFSLVERHYESTTRWQLRRVDWNIFGDKLGVYFSLKAGV